jgi:hypothetical protein
MIRRFTLFAALVALAGCQQKPFQGYKSPDGRFEVKFTGEPRVETKAVAGTTVKMYSAESWDRSYMVGWSDLPIPSFEPESRTSLRLFDARDGALEAVDAKSNGTTKTFKLQERFPGIEFGGSSDGKNVRGQAILVGHRMYQVIVVGSTPEICTSPEADEFISSFKVFDVEDLIPRGSSQALPPPPPKFPIESAAGRFIANYPQKSKKFTKKIGDNEFTGYECESKGDTCSVSYVDLPIPGGEPEAKIKERLEAARTAALAELNATLGEEKGATIGSGRPGREFTATAGEKHIRGRVFLVGARLYRILVVGSETFAASKDATAFLDSFKLN